MKTSSNLPTQFEAIRDRDELILWIGKPNFTAFVIRGIPYLIFGILWGSVVGFGMILKAVKGIPENPGIFMFFLFFLTPLWWGILNLIRLFLVHGNTCYAFSTKRLMLRSGFWGTDFKVIDYDKISDIEVTVNPVENLLGVGTIQAYSGRTDTEGARLAIGQFIGISDSYSVFKKMKEVSMDIKTDISYPNGLRPGLNPGYRTKYERK